ncbi:iron-containing alcohol dehydrogenase [Atrimonas thermophila]|uniref:iron-containing alcohol dehydrogenase n=1 Tax=Atrimonas thermophila TaxID=3064161 RepID=UPI00399CF3B0
MENFIFHNPTKLIFGKGTIPQIGSEIAKQGYRKVLLLYGQGSIKRNGVYERVISSLKENDLQCVELSGVKPNPLLSKVKEGIELSSKEKVEAILAVGGGSVIDSAKAIAVGFYYSGDIWDIFLGKHSPEKALPIFTVLTMSATGSEMNCGAVVTKDETLEKYSFVSEHVYPRVSIVDPSVQFTLPAEQTVYGAIDTIAHVLEYYFDGSDSEIQNELSEGIIRAVISTTERLLQNPKDYEARSNMAWSATVALNGLTGAGRRGGDWSCHRIEHALSALYDIAHGAGLAIVMPAWMKYVYTSKPAQFERFAHKVFGIIEKGEEGIIKGIAIFKEWMKQVGAPVSLEDIGVEEKDIPKIVDNVMALGEPFGNLRMLYRKDVEAILKIASL